MATFIVLGDRAPVPCDIGDADAVAMAFMEKGITVTPLPFRQPPLLDKEVRIKVTHSGLCHSDIFHSTEGWGAHGCFPLVPGHEIVGIVEKVGEKVTKVEVGDKVAFGCFSDCCDSCYLCKKGHDNFCAKRDFTYNPYFGGYATSFQSRGDFFFKLQDSFDGADAPLLCAGITTYNPLIKHARPGMKVGIVGIGGLGHLAIQYANKMGCEVTAISTSPNKEEEAKGFGAHHFINSKDPESLQRNERTLDLILDSSTGLNLRQNFKLLKPRGSTVIVGNPDADYDANLNIFEMLMAQQELHGSLVGSRVDIEEMFEFSRIHNIKPLSEVYAFADTQTAVDSLAKGLPHFPKYRNVLETESFFKTFTPSSH